ncbi:MAG: hypothetical protein H7831_17350 [Magnetococcus sp. WYHC-3]
MTYCVAIQLRDGLVLASDSRTNAGMDNVGAYPKMHLFAREGERQFVLLAAGNLGTTQAVVNQLRLDSDDDNLEVNLFKVKDLSQAASYVGEISVAVQRRHEQAKPNSNVNFEASFILGGQIAGSPPEIYLIYPQGNNISPSPYHPFLQIGEVKYGKPILDRIVRADMDLENAARCALVSLDSTMRSNLSVGPPIDILIYRRNVLDGGSHYRLHHDNPYLASLRTQWNKGLERLFKRLPRFEWDRYHPRKG